MVFNLFKKKKDKGSAKYESLIISKVVRETPDASTIVFENPDSGKLEYKAGQYLTVICMVDGKEERRCYSLNTSPFLQDLPAITVKKDKFGQVSGFLIDKVKEGDVIQIIKPAGKFTTDFDEKNKRHLALIAGGSGVTPLMSILLSALEKEPKSQVTLIYCNTNENSIIFKHKLDNLTREFPDRFKLIHVLSNPTENWKGLSGRLTPNSLKIILRDFPVFEKTEYFLCGPRGLMDMVEQVLIAEEVNAVNIRKESFTATEPVDTVISAIGTSEVTVFLDHEEYNFTVKSGKKILETALDHDIDMPYSCQSGICTTCRCLLLEGEVEMEEDEGLSDEEIAQGYVLVCVGHPKTAKVKLRVE